MFLKTRVSYSVWAVITTYHNPSGLQTAHIYSHCSEDWKCEMEVPAWLDESALFGDKLIVIAQMAEGPRGLCEVSFIRALTLYEFITSQRSPLLILIGH